MKILPLDAGVWENRTPGDEIFSQRFDASRVSSYMMRLWWLISLLLVMGCTASTSPVSPYAPGGECYVAPGIFNGTWWTDDRTLNDPQVTYSNHCTAIISEADSLFSAKIANDSTGEVLTLRGFHTLVANTANPADRILHFFFVHDSSGGIINDTVLIGLNFWPDMNSFEFHVDRKVPATGFSESQIEVSCTRKL